MKVRSFVEPMYQVSITYLIGGSVEQMMKYINKKHNAPILMSWSTPFEWGPDANTTDGYQFHINAPLGIGETFYVWVAKPTASLMFHETLHLVGDILHTRGISYTYESEEAFTYLGGWIFNKVYSLIK